MKIIASAGVREKAKLKGQGIIINFGGFLSFRRYLYIRFRFVGKVRW